MNMHENRQNSNSVKELQIGRPHLRQRMNKSRGARDEDWEQCMAGFEGISELEEKHTGFSQVSIQWDSSDEEANAANNNVPKSTKSNEGITAPLSANLSEVATDWPIDTGVSPEKNNSKGNCTNVVAHDVIESIQSPLKSSRTLFTDKEQCLDGTETDTPYSVQQGRKRKSLNKALAERFSEEDYGAVGEPEIKTKRRMLIESKVTEFQKEFQAVLKTTARVPTNPKQLTYLTRSETEVKNKRKNLHSPSSDNRNGRKCVLRPTPEILDHSRGNIPQDGVIEEVESPYKTQPHTQESTLESQESRVSVTSKSVYSQSICDYDSGSDIGVVHMNCSDEKCDICQLLKPQDSSSPSISQATSPSECQTGGEGQKGQEGKVKVSDWAQSVQGALNKTPHKSNSADDLEQEHGDSTKKNKKKYIKDGLAERLQRLVTREKSAFSIWSHRMNHQSNKDTSKTLLVHVQSVKAKFSLAECECRVLKESERTAQEDDQTHIEDADVVVLFTGAMAANVTVGSLVRVYPPWQNLSLGSGKVVILCTNLCHAVGSKVVEKSSHVDDKWRTGLSWSCPCLSDLRIPSNRCPAHLTPCSVFRTLQPAKVERNTGQSKHEVRKVESIEAKANNVTILGGIEAGLGGQSISLTALVQRVCDRRAKKSAGGPGCWQGMYSLILQDRQETLCELEVPWQCRDQGDWKTLLEEGEGKLYSFHGLCIGQRTNRARHSGLFSMLDSIWASNHGPSSQCPGFCYILKAILGESSCTVSDSTMPVTVIYSSPQTTTLSDALKQGVTSRCAVAVNCVHVFDQDQQTILYVCDESTAVEPVFVEGCNLAATAPLLHHRLHIRELVLKRGKLILDNYSTVLKIDDRKERDRNVLHLKQMSPEVKQFDLVNMTGTVVGVDEETAYSWLTCPNCDADQLTGGTASNPFLYCKICRKGLREPKINMSLAVFADCPQLQGVSLKIQLLQETIKKLLPQDPSDDGHEVECVLGKPLGPISCRITSCAIPYSMKLQEIDDLHFSPCGNRHQKHPTVLSIWTAKKLNTQH